MHHQEYRKRNTDTVFQVFVVHQTLAQSPLESQERPLHSQQCPLVWPILTISLPWNAVIAASMAGGQAIIARKMAIGTAKTAGAGGTATTERQCGPGGGEGIQI